MKFCESLLPRILLVQRFIFDNHFFGLSDHGENEWLTFLISVGTDTEVDLVGVVISLVKVALLKNGIWWAFGHIGESKIKGLILFHLGVDELLVKFCFIG